MDAKQVFLTNLVVDAVTQYPLEEEFMAELLRTVGELGAQGVSGTEILRRLQVSPVGDKVSHA